MGFPANEFRFCDVLSTEDSALAMVPSSVVAVILLYPTERGRHGDDLREILSLAPGSFYLDKLFSKTKTKTPEEIWKCFEEDDELELFFTAVQRKQASRSNWKMQMIPTSTHFVCFRFA
ncbi:hypothetical protein PHYPSEUDO_012357 [Phytophthora pseudosyringae]|uniref:UCH catalytic domain-containing protein n=1 Tax=Phytophthora pseudosyringae TaxID=221518 RepID=A0A8T1VA55_9STRA|nr:hypothetical protein PHYPSEUDO_012357 [Phytophthora pseudosyringae]